MTKPETIDKKYAGKLSKEGLELMQGLLMMDPKDRFTAKQALMHQFFDGLRTAAEEEQIIEIEKRALNVSKAQQIPGLPAPWVETETNQDPGVDLEITN